MHIFHVQTQRLQQRAAKATTAFIHLITTAPFQARAAAADMDATKVTIVSSCGDEFELDEEVATHDRGRLRRSSHPSPQCRHQDFGQGGRLLEEARRDGEAGRGQQRR